MTKELSEELYLELTTISDQAEAHFDEEQYDLAIKFYKEALALLPPPVEDWEAFTWLNAGIGDAYFFQKNYKEALPHFAAADSFEDYNNPFIHLRIGQCCVELGQLEQGKDFLLDAYQAEGEVIFEMEDEKYRALIQESINN